MHRNLLLLLFIWGWFVFPATAQSKRNYSAYMFIYQLNSEEANEMYAKNKFKFKPEHFHTKVDSFLVDKSRAAFNNKLRQLNNGYYVLVRTRQNVVNYSLFTQSDLSPQVFNNEKEQHIAVYRKGNVERISDAKLFVKGTPLTYRSETQSYPLPKSTKNKTLMIVHQSDTVYYKLTEYNASKRNYNPARRFNGFIAFSKPKYLPSDTLKFKALALKKNGKPYTKNVVMKITERYGRTVKLDTLENDGKGSFTYEIPLSDSLKLDKNYKIRLYHKYHKSSYKSRTLLYDEFYLEDYQLDESFLGVETSKSYYSNGDTAVITLTGKDVNGLPLMNVAYEVNIVPGTVTNVNGNVAYVPALIHEEAGTLGTNGKHTIRIPVEELPATNANYKVAAKFISNNNETKNAETYLRVGLIKNYIDAGTVSDSIKVAFISNDQSTSEKGEVMTVFKSGDTLKQSISFPSKIKIHPNAVKYLFATNQLNESFHIPPANVSYNHLRTKDSVLINASSSKNIPLHYTLFKNGNVFKKGTAVKVQFQLADASKSEYKISYQYIWKGENHTEDFTIEHAEDQLTVELQQPDRVFPGGTTKIKVKVANYWGKPVKDANVTSSAVNSLFTEPKQPEAPNFKKTQRPKIMVMGSHKMAINRTEKIEDKWKAVFNLDTIHYYRLLYQAREFYQEYFKINTNDAQFWSFVMHKEEPQPVYAIFIDGQPYYYNNERNSFYRQSVAAKSGYHNVRIKTYKHEITIDSVLFKQGHKLELAVDLKTKHPHVKVKGSGKKPSKKDAASLEKSMLYLKGIKYFSIGYFKQGDYIQRALSYNNSKVGVFNPNQPIEFYNNKHNISFDYEPGKVHYIDWDEIIKIDKDEYLKDKSKYVKSSFSLKLKKPGRFPNYNLPTGELVYSQKDIDELNQPKNSGRAPAIVTTKITRKGNGMLMMEALSDSTFFLARVNGNAGGFNVVPQFTGRTPNRKKGYKAEFFDLKPGIYEVELITKHGHSITINSVEIRPNTLTCHKTENTNFKPVAANTVSGKKLNIQHLKNNTILSGTVYQSNGKTYSGGTTVTLCKGTKKLAAVTTSSIGRFNFPNMKPGIYTLWFEPVSDEKLAVIGVPVKTGKAPNLTVTLHRKPVAYNKNKYRTVYTQSHYHVLSDTVIIDEPYTRRNIPKENQVAILSKYGIVLNQFNVDQYDDYENEGYYYKSKYTNNRTQYKYNNDHVSLYGSSYYPGKYSLRRIFRIRRKSSFYRQSYSWLGARSSRRKVRAKFGGGSPRAKNGSSYAYAGAYSHNNYDDEEEESYEYNITRRVAELPGVQGRRIYLDNLADSTELPSTPPKSIRDNFSDYAYWQPTLYTDENGEAEFEVTFPDNITEWNSYALAVLGKSNGMGQQMTKAYKDVMGKLFLPRFITKGDIVHIKGEASNHSGKSYEATSKFSINGEVVGQKDTTLEKFFNHNYQLQSGNSDSLKIMFELNLKNGYTDAELRELPVVPLGIEVAEGNFIHLSKDTSITINLEPDAQYTLFAADNPLDVLMERVEEIKKYPYYCNEQIASKITALLMEKEIRAAQGKSFKHAQLIRNLIGKLKKNQQEGWAWGWWSSSHINMNMTIYIAKALAKAEKMGYNVSFYNHTLDQLKTRVGGLEGWQLLNTLELFAELGDSTINYKLQLDRVRVQRKELYADLMMTRIKQQRNFNYNTENLLSKKKATLFGSYYWGEHSFSWYNNSTQSTLLAYRILRDANRKNELSKIRSYFLEPNNENTWRNTYETASVLSTILPDLLEGAKKTYEKPQLKLNNAVQKTIANFPMKIQLDPGSQSLTVDKSGKTPIFFTAYKREWIIPENKYTEYFDIKTYFDEGKEAETIQLDAGENTMLVAKVTVKKKADYVMIEVPIPAGCTYNSKGKTNYAESHRESHKHKVSIFCEAMNPGDYEFKIDLQSRFKGRFQLNAAKAELMYFPTFKGYNKIKKVEVK